MKITNRLDLPEALVRALAADEYDRGNADISVTGLTSPPRLVALREAHGDELEEDVSDLIYALLGKAVHYILEKAAPEDVIAEKRYFMTAQGPLGPMVISGQMDSIELDGGRISDWKTAKVAEMMFGVKIEREQQLNVYRILLYANGILASELRDVFILRDWSKVRADRGPVQFPTLTGSQPEDTYPDSQVVIHDIRVWSPEEAQAYITERVALHQTTQAAYNSFLADVRAGDTPRSAEDPQSVLPECSDEERWARPATFAAMKRGAKVASRVFETEAEAEAYVAEHTGGFDYWTEEQTDGTVKVFKGENAKRASKTFPSQAEADAWVEEQGEVYEVQARKGESIRCQYYCPVSAICEQWRKMREVDAA